MVSKLRIIRKQAVYGAEMTRTIRRFCERIRNRLNRAKRCRRVRDRRPLTFDGNEHRPWGHEPRRVGEQCPARPSYILVNLDQAFPIACVEMPSPWREAPELVLRPGLRLPLQRHDAVDLMTDRYRVREAHPRMLHVTTSTQQQGSNISPDRIVVGGSAA